MPNFHGLSDEDSRLENSSYVILPVPYEWTTSYLKGTEYGPQAIIEASDQLEFFDHELECEPVRAGIHTAKPVETVLGGPEQQCQLVFRRCLELIQIDKLVGMLGGEHSITYGGVRAALQLHPELTVLQLDAHADLRESYRGDRFGHASIMRRVRDLTTRTVSVGIRSLAAEEHDYINANGVKIYLARFLEEQEDALDRIMADLDGKIYLTVDLDVYDWSVMPAVGTPEPGGLGWYQTLTMLRAVIQKCNLVAFDVVELSPIGGHHAAAFAAAKLVYKIIGYDFCKKQGR